MAKKIQKSVLENGINAMCDLLIEHVRPMIREEIRKAVLDHQWSDASSHARALSKLGAAKGGAARASKMTKEKRALMASRAVKAGWNKPKVTP